VGTKGACLVSGAQANVDPSELAKFAARADSWWDRDGPFKSLHDINPLRVAYIAERCRLQGARVLDVGCGGGLLSEAMARRGAHVTGLDLASENIEAARQHAAAHALDIDYRCEEIADFAQAHALQFDVVTCLELLEHVPRPEAVVAACAQAVRPGGAVFFSTINRNAKSFLLAIVAAEYLLKMVPRGTHEYLKLIRPAELVRWSRHAELLPREITGMHFNPLTRSYFLGGNADVNYLCHTIKQELPA
jgi:2-polyprenyl-6-hydroxyphenyl methylase/3-demethylubiquinone-9 3-methyltransferase